MNGNEQKIERVTSVLPCADAPLTLANLAEYILTDIWVRFRKQDGRPVLRNYVDDALSASRSGGHDAGQREAAAREAVRRPRTLKLFQLEGDSVAPAAAYAAGSPARSPGAVHLLQTEGAGESAAPGLTADTYLRYLDPAALRYNIAADYRGAPSDLRMSAADFRERYNRDVVGLFAEVFARLDGEMQKAENDNAANIENRNEELRQAVVQALAESRDAYENWNFARVLEISRASAERIHEFMNAHARTVLRPSPERGAVLGAARVLSFMLAPILPVFAAGVKEFFKISVLPSFQDSGEPPPQSHACCRYRPLAAPLGEEDLRDMFQAGRQEAPAPTAITPVRHEGNKAGLISPEELGRVELRAGLVRFAEIVTGADKLLRLEIDLGEPALRPVLAGLRGAYEPDQLKGLTIACVTNLPARETRFGISKAMILAAGEPPVVFTAHGSVAPGERLR